MNDDVIIGASRHGNSGGKKKKGMEKSNNTNTETSAYDTSSVSSAIPIYQPTVNSDSDDALLLISLKIIGILYNNTSNVVT